MNLKDFLRGLGAGIIFSALIMLVAYMTSGSYKISDDEVIKRAEKLGMVMDERPIVDDSKKTEDTTETMVASETEATTAEETTTEVTTTEATTTEATTTEATTTEKATTEATTTEKATTEKTTTEKATTEKTTEEKPNSKYTTVEITVTKGMDSETIAKMVQDAGIIDDYLDFDAYLNKNGYANKLSVNTFKLNSNMTYEQIAKELTKGDK